MSETEQYIPALDGFLVPVSDQAIEKFIRFKEDGADKLHYVWDFDGTITSTDHLDEDLTVWGLMDRLVPDDERGKYDRLTQRYQDLEDAGQLTPELALKWWKLSFGLYVEKAVNINDVNEKLGQLAVREGTTDLFKLCADNNIPQVILSAGVGNAIETFTENAGIVPTEIISTRLRVKKDGQIVGWKRKSIVHALNKHEHGHNKLSQIAAERPNTIVVGDSLGDVNMVSGSDNIIRARVGDERRIKAIGNKYYQESRDAGFDIIVGKSVVPLLNITRWIIGKEVNLQTSS